MNMITLIFIMVTAYTNEPDKEVVLTYNPICTDPKEIKYDVDNGIHCIGSATVDTIFKGGFE